MLPLIGLLFDCGEKGKKRRRKEKMVYLSSFFLI